MSPKPKIRLLKKKDSPSSTSLNADLEMTSEVAQAVTPIASPLDVDSDSDVSAIAPLHTKTIPSTVEDSVTSLTESSSSVVPSDSLSTEPELPLFQAIGVLFGAIELNHDDGAFYVRFAAFALSLEV